MSLYVKALLASNILLLLVCAYFILQDRVAPEMAQSQPKTPVADADQDLTLRLVTLERHVHDVTKQLSTLQNQIISSTDTSSDFIQEGSEDVSGVSAPDVPLETIILPPEKVVDKPIIDEALAADLKLEAENYKAMLGRLRSVSQKNQNKAVEL